MSGTRCREAAYCVALGCCLLAGAARLASAQSVSQKGFAEVRGTFYPDTTPKDATQAVGEALLRYEAVARPASWLRFTGVVEARADTHDQTSDDWEPDWLDRGEQRSPLSIRRLNATLSRGRLTVELGKQFVRWGKADLLNPTDRFAPRDFLNVFDAELLAVTAARVIVEKEADTLDLVWVPAFTPSRTPLPGQRWAPEVPVPPGVQVIDDGRSFPEGGQLGARWNHIGAGFEFSLSGYRGYNHLPGLDAQLDPLAFPPTVHASLFYPRLWTVGGDVAIPWSAFTVKGEAAYFGTDDARVDEYLLYVIQLERQAGEWFFVGGYAGEYVAADRGHASFAPDRALTKAFLGRAGYTLDTNRSLAVEGALQQDLDGHWLRAEYSQASGQHLRVTVRASLIGGDPDTFFGRYRHNSNLMVTARYSF